MKAFAAVSMLAVSAGMLPAQAFAHGTISPTPERAAQRIVSPILAALLLPRLRSP
jgi:hypothetical protein